MRRAAVASAVVVGLAVAGCNGDGGGRDATPASTTGAAGPAGTTRAAGPGARAAVLAFYRAAGRGDFPRACALLAPQADAPQTTATLLEAMSGNTFIKLGTDCESTLSALANSQPWLLDNMVIDVSAARPGKVDISGGRNRVKFHATLVQVGGAWRILAVSV